MNRASVRELVEGRFEPEAGRALLAEYAAEDTTLTVRFGGEPLAG